MQSSLKATAAAQAFSHPTAASATPAGRAIAASAFANTLAAWHAVLDRPTPDAQALLANLEDLYRAVIGTDFSKLQIDDVQSIAHVAIEDLFDFNLRLRDRMPEWRAQGLLTPQAATAARNAIRVLRYTCDILGEIANGYQRLAPGGATFAAFEGPADWTLMHPAMASDEPLRVRSGDVILVRGQMANSAAIARVGDIDSQFSHIGIVHVGEDGGLWFVEALIEDGASVTPLADALGHGLGRAVIFRARDQVLAARASRMIHDRVVGSRAPGGTPIPYDFTMELAGADTLFCSKLVRLAYQDASDGALVLPLFHTRIDMANRDFVERIGVTARETFAPADIEVEPAFDVVAEWRDYRVTSRLRLQDLIMSKLFDWMDQYGYVFRDDARIRAIQVLGRISSMLPDTVKTAISSWAPKVPWNMSRSTIGVIAMLHKTMLPILARLEALEAAQIERTGRPLHPVEAQRELEQIRVEGQNRIGYLRLPT